MFSSNTCLFIRTDADSVIGIGHIMRCIAVGQRWLKSGGKVVFLTNCRVDNINKRIIEEGFDLVQIPQSFPDQSDITNTIAYIHRKGSVRPVNCPWLIIDGYHFTSEYHRRIRDAGIKLMVMDDMGHLPEYYADILLNQNINADEVQYKSNKDCLKLLGPEYVLLRSEFLKYLDRERNISEKARNIIVTLGGADKDNVTTKVIDSLKQLKDRDLQIKIISGHANMYKEKLNSLLSQISANFELLSSVKEMPSLMDWADMAISAAGSTCYELAFMGLPSVLITIADNQKGIGERLERNGAAIHIGAAYEIDCDILRDTISSLLSDKSRRKKMSRNCINLVDGYGAEKLVEIIGVLGENEFEIKNFLRRASERDCHSILQLANDPEVRKSSFSHDLISYDDHYSWYMDKLNSRKSCIFIVDVGGQLCGQVRYEKEGDFAIVHFSVAPAFRGRGLGRKMIEATVKDACGVLETCLIRGLVISSNRPSINTFIKAGFKKVGDRNLSGTDCVIFEKIIKSINQG